MQPLTDDLLVFTLKLFKNFHQIWPQKKNSHQFCFTQFGNFFFFFFLVSCVSGRWLKVLLHRRAKYNAEVWWEGFEIMQISILQRCGLWNVDFSFIGRRLPDGTISIHVLFEEAMWVTGLKVQEFLNLNIRFTDLQYDGLRKFLCYIKWCSVPILVKSILGYSLPLDSCPTWNQNIQLLPYVLTPFLILVKVF